MVTHKVWPNGGQGVNTGWMKPTQTQHNHSYSFWVIIETKSAGRHDASTSSTNTYTLDFSANWLATSAISSMFISSMSTQPDTKKNKFYRVYRNNVHTFIRFNNTHMLYSINKCSRVTSMGESIFSLVSTPASGLPVRYVIRIVNEALYYWLMQCLRSTYGTNGSSQQGTKPGRN